MVHGWSLQVLEVKRVIEATNAEFPAAQLKLIHSGKILKDEHTLEEYKIKEDEFLVCMVTKVRTFWTAIPSITAIRDRTMWCWV